MVTEKPSQIDHESPHENHFEGVSKVEIEGFSSHIVMKGEASNVLHQRRAMFRMDTKNGYQHADSTCLLPSHIFMRAKNV